MDFFRAFKAPSKFAQEYLFFSDGLGHLKSIDFYLDRESFNNYLVLTYSPVIVKYYRSPVYIYRYFYLKKNVHG